MRQVQTRERYEGSIKELRIKIGSVKIRMDELREGANRLGP